MKRLSHRLLSILLSLTILCGLGQTAFAAAFTDTSPSAWYTQAVDYILENGLMSGTGGGKFSPDTPMSRAMLATVLHRMDAAPAPTSAASFSDVPHGAYYEQAVAWAAENRIVSGIGGGRFGSKNHITRQDLAVMLYRYGSFKGYDLSAAGDLSKFPDSSRVAGYARQAMRWAVGAGIMQGDSGRIMPTGNASRAQVAVLLMRFTQNTAGSQPIFTNYTTLGQESDSEGQLILYESGQERYRFFTGDLDGYQSAPEEIQPGEVYVSPSLVSMFGLSIGDEITFPIARSGQDLTLTVAGFYEDPIMGSSMIGMKGFLVGETDYQAAVDIASSASIDALAREGAMLHIFSTAGLPAAELNAALNERTALAQFTEFTHSREAITGFMLILHNAFSAMLLAFVAVLLGAVLAVLGHSISSTIRADYKNMGVLKIVGLTTHDLRRVLLAQYGAAILAGMAMGLLLTFPVSRVASAVTLTTTGILVPTALPIGWLALSFGVVLILLGAFIYWRAGKIGKKSPMKAIRGEAESSQVRRAGLQISGKILPLRLALRQVMSGKRLYAGALAVAVLLSFFAAMIGRMDAWLGPDGKGMMDAFNPANHDIGVQMFGDSTMEQGEKIVRRYSEIADTYLLAMPSVSVNGVDYTANVISEPERFHILEGRTCTAENEIVLTEFVAANLGATIGDTVTVQGDMASGEYVITGIYSCANDMGDNVGLSQAGYLQIGLDDPRIWCWHYFLSDPGQKTAITQALENQFGGDVHVHENTWPGLFGIIAAMRALVVLMYAVTAAFILIVTGMTVSRLLAAEQQNIAIYKALGFMDGQQRLSFSLRFGMAGAVGAVAGILLSVFLADPVVSAAMKLAGISNFASALTLSSTLIPGLTVTLLFAGFAYLAAGKIRRVSLTTLINE